MELKCTSKALSDITRLYEFLASVNQPAAARTVQQLTAAPTTLLTNPRIANGWKSSSQGMYAEFRSANTRCVTR